MIIFKLNLFLKFIFLNNNLKTPFPCVGLRQCGHGSEQGVYGLTRIFAPLFTYDSVVFYARSVDA
jgi:hypothetical protein